MPSWIGTLTFDNLEGKELQFLGDHRPAMRCINFKAQLAILIAEHKGWVPAGSLVVDDYGSDGDYKDMIDLYFSRMEEASSVGGESA